jgi:inner membrane protein YidH
MDMADRPASGPSDYLAAERTFLAWIRTGLALMGFGFVVARFGLFLEALQGGARTYQARPYGPSFWFGTGLIVLGVAVNVFCARSHVRLVHDLNRGGPAVHRPSRLAVAVAVILAVLGLAMAVYLISVQDPGSHPGTNKEESIAPSHHLVDETVANLG